MLENFSSNAIMAKCRGIYGKSLTKKNYEDLLRQKTVPEVCAYLKNNTAYSGILASVNEFTMRRAQLESLIKREYMRRYLSLLHYTVGANNKFYKYIFTDVEITVLLQVIMALNTGDNQIQVARVPLFLKEYVSYDMQAVVQVKTFQELLMVLKDTGYYKVLKPLLFDNTKVNYGQCERELKVYSYAKILKTIGKEYKGKRRDDLVRAITTQIDLLNMSLIYRMKVYFMQNSDKIKEQLIPYSYRLSARSVDKLLSMENKEEFLSNIKLEKYNKKMQGVYFNNVEGYTKRLSYITSRRTMRNSTYAPTIFYSLLALMQIEMENVTIIIEGVRYGQTTDEVRSLLIM